MEICDFCGKYFNGSELESTSFVGYYCMRCHNINANQSGKAIKEIKRRIANGNKIKE